MRITLSWLKDHLKTSLSPEELGHKLVQLGHEVEELVDTKKALAPFKVAKILTVEKHPDAQRLSICTLDCGDKVPLAVVCGGVNVRQGLVVVYAAEGTTIPASGMVLKKAKIRGVESRGMICSARELGLGEDEIKGGIFELNPKLAGAVGQSIVEVLPCGDVLFDLGLTPNRADCFGAHGLARDLAAGGAGTLLPLEEHLVPGHFQSPITVTRARGAEHAAPHFMGRVIRGVKNGPSPQWLQDKLKAVGLKSISALVDITNYFSHDRCRPLHVFDADKLQGDLHLRLAQEGEQFKALDEVTYALSAGMLVICDNHEIVSLAGIMGGLDSGCTFETVNVFLEAAYFDPPTIAKTGQKLNIISDARLRFERGIDPLGTQPGLEAATQMILDLCGGEASHLVHVGQAPYEPQKIPFAPHNVESLTGLHVGGDRCAEILTALGCQVQKTDAASIVIPPSWRHDMAICADCVEEVIRIEGFDKVPLTPLPTVDQSWHQPFEALSPKMVALERVKRLLAARGLMETISYVFISKALIEAFGQSGLRVANPISEDMQYMRPTLLAGLTEALTRNQARGLNHLRFFEAGAVFNRDLPAHQEGAVAGVYVGQTARQHWSKTEHPLGPLHVKADVEALLAVYGIGAEKVQLVQEAAALPAYMHPGRTALICQGPKRVLGYFGALHPTVLKALDIRGQAFGFEVYVERLPPPRMEKKAPLGLSAFQPSERDFALVVPATTSAASLQALMKKADPALVQWVDIFDVYEGKGVPQGMKSVGIRVRLQGADRTLSDEDLKSYGQAALKLLQDKAGATLR